MRRRIRSNNFVKRSSKRDLVAISIMIPYLPYLENNNSIESIASLRWIRKVAANLP